MMLAALLAVAYVLLPFWLPTSLLKRWVADDMARQMGVAVTIDDMSIGWRDGVQILGLTVGEPEGFGDEPMLTVARIHAEFSPLRYLLAKRVAGVQIDQPKLLAIVRLDRTTNIAPLSLLTFDIDTERIDIRDAIVTFDPPGQDSPTTLAVSSIRFDTSRRGNIATIALSAELQQSQGAAPIKLRVEPGSESTVAARATFSFTNVDLRKLALPELLNLPVGELGGLCSGSVELQVSSNGVVDEFALHVSVADLDIQRTAGRRLPVIDRADLDMTATYDPLAPDGRLNIRSLRVHLPGALSLTGQAVLHTDMLAASWQAVESLDIQGRVFPSRLVEMFMGREDWASTGLTVAGPVDVDVSIHRSTVDLAVRANIDAAEADVTRGEDILKPAGRALACELTGTFNERSDSLTISRGSYMTLGNNRLWSFGEMHNVRRQADALLADWPEMELLQIGRAIADGDWNGGAELADLQAIDDMLGELSPAALAEARLDGLITANWFVFERAGRRIELHLASPADAQLTVGEWFAKPAGEAITLTIAAAIDQTNNALSDIDIDFTCGQGRLGVDNGSLARAGGQEQADDIVEVGGNITAENYQDIAACFPLLARLPDKAAGGFRGEFGGRYNSFTGEGRGHAAVRDLLATWSAEAGRLSQGVGPVSGRIAGELTIMAARTADGLVSVDIDAKDLEARIEGGGLTRTKKVGSTLHGRVTAEPDRPMMMGLFFGQSELALVLPADGGEMPYWMSLTIDDAALAMLPELVELAERTGLRGSVGLTGVLPTRGSGGGHAAEIDATDLGFRLSDDIVKPRGTVAWATVRASPGENGALSIDIERGTLGKIEVAGQVRLTVPTDLAGPIISSGELLLTFDEGESICDFVPQLTGRLTAAAGRAELNWTAAETSADVRWRTDLEKLTFRHNDKDIQFAGDLTVAVSLARATNTQVGWGDVEVTSLRADALEFWLDDSHGFIVADLLGPPTSAAGSVHLLADKLDTQALADWLAGPQQSADDATSSDADLADLNERALAAIAAAGPYLLASEVQVKVDVADLRVYDSVVDQFYDLKNVTLSATVDHGYAQVELASGLNSGTLRRRYQTHFGPDDPTLRYDGQLVDAISRENIRPRIALSFPNNTVAGLFSRQMDLEMPLHSAVANWMDWRYPLGATGQAEVVATDGILEGEPAPKFLARLLPSLNTARYEYKKMTAFVDYGEDGLVVNDMVFDGETYDMYMNGTTSADDVAAYELGVILLSQPQSAQWNHTYRQGRMPILTFQGRAAAGRLHDVTVSYPWPNETLYVMFMKNNYLYRVWLERQRRRETTP